MSVLKEFRDFALRGNVVDLAVGVVIGAAFGKIVSSLVADVIMPPLGLILGGVDETPRLFVEAGSRPPGGLEQGLNIGRFDRTGIVGPGAPATSENVGEAKAGQG